MLNGLFSSLKASCRKMFNRGAGLNDVAPDSFQDDPFARFMRAVLDTPTDAFPETIELTPANVSVLAAVFSYRQDVYDLAEYEAIEPGLGRRIWDMIESERKHQEHMAEMRAKYPALKEYDYKSGYKPF